MKLTLGFVQGSLTSFSYFATCKNILQQTFHQSQNSHFQRIWLEQQQLVCTEQGWDDSILHMQYMLEEGSIYCIILDECFGPTHCYDDMLKAASDGVEALELEEEGDDGHTIPAKEEERILLNKIQVFVSHASKQNEIGMYDLIYISWISKWIMQHRSRRFILFNVLHLFNSIFKIPWAHSTNEEAMTKLSNTIPKNYNIAREIVYTECAYINDLCLLYRYKCKLAQLLHKGRLTILFMNLEQLIDHHAQFIIDLETSMCKFGQTESSKVIIIQYLLNQFATTEILNLYFIWSTEYLAVLDRFRHEGDHSISDQNEMDANYQGMIRRTSQQPTPATPPALNRGNSYKLQRFRSVRSVRSVTPAINKIYTIDSLFQSGKDVEMILIKPVQRICKYEMFFNSSQWKHTLQHLNRQIQLSGTATDDFDIFRHTVLQWKGLDLAQLGMIRYRSQSVTKVIVINRNRGISTKNVWIYIFSNGLIFFEKHENDLDIKIEIKGYLLFKNITGPPNVNQETKTIVLATHLDFMQSVTIFFQNDSDFAEILLCLL